MLLGGRVLVVDDAPFMLEILGELLRPHFTHVLLASTYREGLEKIEQGSVIDVIITDVILPNGNGFKLLEQIYNAPAPKRTALPRRRLHPARRQLPDPPGAERRPAAVSDRPRRIDRWITRGKGSEPLPFLVRR